MGMDATAIVFLLAASVTGCLAVAGCVPRDYGRGSIVCVCNSTRCDFLGPISPEEHGVAAVYESNKAGLRFHKSVVRFADSIGLPSTEAVSLVLTINASKTYQEIVGFGGAFTDAAGINIKSLPTRMQDDLLRSYYAPEGLSYNVGRIPMASTDFSTRLYTYLDDPDDFNLTKFSLAQEDYGLKIPFIQRAVSLAQDEVYLFGSPWSGPAWMKTNGALNGRGRMKGNPGGKYYKTWAKYFVRFLQEYGKHGVRFWGLTVENEPMNGEVPLFPFQCMGYTPEIMRDFVKLDLGPTLRSNGYGAIKLMILDDQRYEIPRWTETIFQDANASSFVSGTAVHWYGDDVTSPWILDNAHSRFPNKFILATEACEGYQVFIKEKVSLGNWNRAETYAFDIIQDLSHWVTGWVDWNLALNPQGGPNWVKNFVDSPIIVNATSKEFYKQPMYYSLAHFTKFLPRGSLRIDAVAESGLDNLVTYAAFKTPQGAKVVIVLNRDNSQHTVVIRDGAKSFAKAITERSIQSFVWW
ncbi:lysosomal acid glucosylceramidase-like isoform X1 [Ornithodoros turicata]|uniref:lysosomal acid glucosylceramidase-like isoform X1 n=1 Tax=Ornithodoros turicata TaxID=34597 RepID=UPI0031396EF3